MQGHCLCCLLQAQIPSMSPSSMAIVTAPTSSTMSTSVLPTASQSTSTLCLFHEEPRAQAAWPPSVYLTPATTCAELPSEDEPSSTTVLLHVGYALSSM